MKEIIELSKVLTSLTKKSNMDSRLVTCVLEYVQDNAVRILENGLSISTVMEEFDHREDEFVFYPEKLIALGDNSLTIDELSHASMDSFMFSDSDSFKVACQPIVNALGLTNGFGENDDLTYAISSKMTPIQAVMKVYNSRVTA